MTLYAGLIATPDPDEWQPTAADVPHDGPAPWTPSCGTYRERDGRRTYCLRGRHDSGPHVPGTSYPVSAWQPSGAWCPDERPFG